MLREIAGAAKVVYGNIVMPRQYQQAVNRNSCLAAFVICIGALADVQDIGNILLRQMSVFPYFTNTFIIFHKLTSHSCVLWL